MADDPSHMRRAGSGLWRRGLEAVSRLVIAALGGIALTFLALTAPPRDFPAREYVKISDGVGIHSAAHELKSQKVVRSPLLLTLLILLRGHDTVVHAGAYRFDKPSSAFTIARKITTSEFNVPSWRVTIPEGLSVKEIGVVFESALSSFDKDEFQALAAEYEGYLFPDTYSISDAITPAGLVGLMRGNFDARLAPHTPAIAASGHELGEVVIMASLLEEEARLTETRRVVAGILWKRLELGMPLQVDATLQYLLGRASHELTLSDLEFDSPYNTYKYAGLPPRPISNPGLDAILAALRPVDSPYLYFLTDDDGTIHYARSFEEHVANKAMYLR